MHEKVDVQNNSMSFFDLYKQKFESKATPFITRYRECTVRQVLRAKKVLDETGTKWWTFAGDGSASGTVRQVRIHDIPEIQIKTFEGACLSCANRLRSYPASCEFGNTKNSCTMSWMTGPEEFKRRIGTSSRGFLNWECTS